MHQEKLAVKSLKQSQRVVLVILHALVIIFVWLSPVLIPWWLIVAGIAAYYLQLFLFGNCILTILQFRSKKRETTFYYFVLKKIGFTPNVNRVAFIADYVMPWVILGLALFWQVVFQQSILVKTMKL